MNERRAFMSRLCGEHTGILLSIVLVYLTLAGGTAVTRQPYGDEGELSSPAYTLAHRGYMAVTVWSDFRDSQKAYWMPPGFFLGQALWQRLVGFGVIQFRLSSVLWGVVVLLCIRFIVDALTKDDGLALVATALLAGDYTFLMHAGIGRCEMMSLALAILSIAAYLGLRQRSLALATVTAHTFVASSALSHPIGAVLWLPALLGVQIWLDWGRRRWMSLVWMALPYVAGALAWGAYIAQDPAQFLAQFRTVSISSGRLSGFTDPLHALQRELVDRFLGYYGVRSGPTASPLVLLKLLLMLGYITALIVAVTVPSVRRLPLVRGALSLCVIQVLLLAFLEGTKQFHYIVHTIPVLTTILACGLWISWKRRTLSRGALIAVTSLLVALQIGPVVFRIREDRYHREFVPTVAALKRYVERGDFVVAEAEFAIPFGFPDNIVSDAAYGYGMRHRPDLVVVDEATFNSNMEGYKSYKFAQHVYMKQVFPSEFEPIFQQGAYTVYKRRDKGPAG